MAKISSRGRGALGSAQKHQVLRPRPCASWLLHQGLRGGFAAVTGPPGSLAVPWQQHHGLGDGAGALAASGPAASDEGAAGLCGIWRETFISFLSKTLQCSAPTGLFSASLSKMGRRREGNPARAVVGRLGKQLPKVSSWLGKPLAARADAEGLGGVRWFLGSQEGRHSWAGAAMQQAWGVPPSPKVLSALSPQDGRAGARQHRGTRALQELEPPAPGQPPRGLSPHPAPADGRHAGEARCSSRLRGTEPQTPSSATLSVRCQRSDSSWVPGAD